ncbi:MAG: tetratricopeptide repeat protein [Planctomycetota bacterium]|nr:tetratricopeptide repeat protein [Planctomycetota bacterium]
MHLNEDYKKALEFFNAEKYRLAIKRFDKAVDANPDEFAPIYRRGICYFELGETEEAHKNFTRAKELDPENKNILLYSGETNLELGNYDEAIKDLGKAKENFGLKMEAKAPLAKAYLERSNQHFSKMDVKAAEKDAVSAFENDPELPEIWLQLGNLYAQMEEFQQSLDYYKGGSQLAPEEGLFHYNMGVNHQKMGNDHAAQRCFKVAEELGFDPSDTDNAF